jgi:hypothetical protein
MLDQFVVFGIITAQEAAGLKAIAERPETVPLALVSAVLNGEV